MTNPYLELSTDDVKSAMKFYSNVFGWKMRDHMGSGYMMVDMAKGAKGTGGITKKMMPGQPTAWLPYLTVDNVKASLDRAKKNGAKVVVPYESIGEMGAIAVFTDPTGATLGLWEQAKMSAKKATKKPAAKTAKKATAKKSASKKATKVTAKKSTKKSSKKN